MKPQFSKQNLTEFDFSKFCGGCGIKRHNGKNDFFCYYCGRELVVNPNEN